MFDETILGDHIKNKANAVRLMNWLQDGAPHTLFDIETAIDDGLQWHSRNTACGSICCAGGAASQMHRGVFGGADPEGSKMPWVVIEEEALEFLGIAWDYKSDMFPIFDPEVWCAAIEETDEDWGDDPDDELMDRLTGPLVASALVIYSLTGQAEDAVFQSVGGM